MIVLGIETSCDETALSIVESANGQHISVRADRTLSQAKLHEQYGGVFPNLAKREHQKNLPLMLPSLLAEAGLAEENPHLDAIAVTVGPGLEPCLWTGIKFAEELAKKWGVPVVPVNHMEGHIFSALLRRKECNMNHVPRIKRTCSVPLLHAPCYMLHAPCFPALALLISGGHTELVLIQGRFTYEIIGRTRDDAVGEAFDKVARLLGLPYPGGPEISHLAEEVRQAEQGLALYSRLSLVKLPRPMLHSNDFDFSFSGIKTAVLYLIKKLPTPLTVEIKAAIAKEFEDAVTEVLIAKTGKAIEQYGAQALLIGGGVIANTHLRRAFEQLATEANMPLFIPEGNLTTDNALMIAVAGFLRLTMKDGSTKPHEENLVAKGNWGEYFPMRK